MFFDLCPEATRPRSKPVRRLKGDATETDVMAGDAQRFDDGLTGGVIIQVGGEARTTIEEVIDEDSMVAEYEVEEESFEAEDITIPPLGISA